MVLQAIDKVAISRDAFILAMIAPTPQSDEGSWTGDNSDVMAPGFPFRLEHITIHYSASHDFSVNNLTVTLDAVDGANYDTILASETGGAVTDTVFAFGPGYVFKTGDQIKLAANMGAHIAYWRAMIRQIA